MIDPSPTDAGGRSFERAAKRDTDDASFARRETSAVATKFDDDEDEAFFKRDASEESEEEKRKRRMVSNRESARRSRQRKLARVAELQDRCAALWSDRAQTLQNIQLMENLVHRVRHENLRLDVDAGRVAHQILLMPSANDDNAPSTRAVLNPKAERISGSAGAKSPTAGVGAADDDDAPPRNSPDPEDEDALLGVFAAAAA